MKVKLDENLSARLVRVLAELGHDADTVPQEGLAGRPDVGIWAAAQTAERFLITQDLDFSDIRRFAPGTHQGYYWYDFGLQAVRRLSGEYMRYSGWSLSKPGNMPLL